MRHSSVSKPIRGFFCALGISILFIAEAAFAVPVYLAPGHLFPSGNYNRDWLKERTKEQIIQSWLRVRNRQNKTGWVAADHVLTRETLKGGWLAFAKETTELRATPVLRSEFLATVRPHEKLNVMPTQSAPGWVFVKRGTITGYISRTSVILADDVKIGTGLSLESQLPIRKQSVPFADPIAKAERYEELTLIGTRGESWGKVSLKSGGFVWWPMNDDVTIPGESKPQILRILTSQLFQRKLYDMASSPLSRELKIASAGGIFRTTNGRDWTKLVKFRNEDHPVAVSGLGRIFIGPYFSDDNGTTFSEYIRWDLLIGRIKQAWKLDGETIRLLEIHPSKREINSVELLLDVGLPHKVTVSTNDLGRNWHARSL